MGEFRVDLSGRVALVTGAGEGIGRAVALVLAGAGAAVCVHDINPDRADAVVAAIQAQGGRAMAWVADVSNRFQVAAMIEALRDRLGGQQIVVNAAGVEKQTPFLRIDEYDWRRVLEINLTGAFFCTQLAARVMVDEGGGVVNIASTAGYACRAPTVLPMLPARRG
jgi:NAD(P)-dependent dehydrogenase (short-subunit alcohol dehydrogenase family)